MRRRITLLLITTLLPLAPLAVHTTRSSRLPACVYEDGSGGPLPCIWDATKRGNGQGRSYWIDRHGKTHFIR